MPFDHLAKPERRNDFHEAATYFVGRTCGGPAKVRYDGHGTFTEYISGHTSGAASHSSLIRVFGKAVTDVVNGMAASGLLCRFRKATTHGRANTYFAIPGTPIE